SDLYNVLAVGSFGDTQEGMDKLLDSLKEISEDYFGKGKRLADFIEIPKIPEQMLLPRDAFYSDKISVQICESVGMTSGEFLMAYPPGIPILCPGEKITQEIIDYVYELKRVGLYVQGTEDSEVEFIKVVK
ncbi:MAG: arginine decarboxylase, partial [Clostridium sp.]